MGGHGQTKGVGWNTGRYGKKRNILGGGEKKIRVRKRVRTGRKNDSVRAEVKRDK